MLFRGPGRHAALEADAGLDEATGRQEHGTELLTEPQGPDPIGDVERGVIGAHRRTTRCRCLAGPRHARHSCTEASLMPNAELTGEAPAARNMEEAER